MGRKVITLRDRELKDRCMELSHLIDRDYKPDLVVGIATGGVMVAGMMFPSVQHCDVVVRRPSTRNKNSFFKAFLSVMPMWILDRMRILEAWWLEKTSDASKIRNLDLSEETARIITRSCRVLVVDDAVDSGVTLSSVLQAIGKVGGSREVRSAVITVTTGSPVVRPDYCLFNDNTLIRFPWSSDMKR